MIDVQITDNYKALKTSPKKIQELVKTVCSRFQVSEAAVSIAIVGNDEIAKLNNQFLNHDFTTDCLSFDLSDSDSNSRTFELVVNAEMAARQAKVLSNTSEAELALYVTHALLHNLGFDDSTEEQAVKMHKAEDEILQHLGYGFVYNKDVGTQ